MAMPARDIPSPQRRISAMALPGVTCPEVDYLFSFFGTGNDFS
jgi:hypothetical protein